MPTDVVHTDVPRPIQGTSWVNNPSVNFVQPLLRGGGLYVNTQGIRIAFYEYQPARRSPSSKSFACSPTSIAAYWQLYAAREALKVRKKTYDSTSAQLQRRHAIK